MTGRIDPLELAKATLSLRPAGDGIFQVEACDHIIGQIISRRRSFGRVVWFWSLSGAHLPEAMDGAGSNASTLQGAKAALQSSLDVWLQTATGQRGGTSWSRQ